MLRQTEEPVSDFLEDWPKHYYEQEDPQKRREYLKKYLSLHPESADDIRREELLQKRFDFSGRETVDLFIRAWMMIRIMENDKVGFLNRKSLEKRLREQMEQLCIGNRPDDILVREWRDFARKYFIICCDSGSYRKAAFGLFSISEEKTALKLARETDLVTRIIPSRLNLEEEFVVFRDTVVDLYCSLLKDGEEFWQKYMNS